jgi:hypothetical protein
MPTEPDPQMRLFHTSPRGQGPRPASFKAMMNMEPRTRNADPASSFEAAERLHRTGLSGKQRLAVYHALREHQGATSKELAKFMDVDRYTPARRLKELEDTGWVCRGRRRKCRVSGVESLTWWIVRRWIDKPDHPEVRKPVAEDGPDGATPRLRSGQASDAERPARVTTPDERRRLRERLAATADERTRRFLAGLQQGE